MEHETAPRVSSGMAGNAVRLRGWLSAVVLAHLLVVIAHGAAHAGAHVPLSPAANRFVFGVILAGPLVGLALMWLARPAGIWLMAITLVASLAFGFVIHFVLASPDQVGRVAREWRPLFTTTAILLAMTEALGAGLAIRLATHRRSTS